MGRMLLPMCALILLSAGLRQSDAQTKGTPTRKKLVVRPAGPVLAEQHLITWYKKSQGIQQLYGKHKRWVYNKLFATDVRSQGIFFYRAPDLGRIDFRPTPVRKGEPSRKRTKAGKPYTVKPSPTPERWISDGKRIVKIDDSAKQKQVFPIPKESQGRNIMNEPLPFLFGLPPKEARDRYDLYMLPATSAKQLYIQAIPKRQKDKMNYIEAMVILDRSTYLPTAVRLVSPNGDQEEVFAFYEMLVNKMPKKNFWATAKLTDILDPTDARKWPAKVQQAKIDPKVGTSKVAVRERMVPGVTNFNWKAARAQLHKAGYRVLIKVGTKAPPAAQFAHVVESQFPAARTKAKAGSLVTLTVFSGRMKLDNPPDLTGWDWKSAQKVLTASGYTVGLRRGAVPPHLGLVYSVSGARFDVKTPNKVVLWLFDKPKAAAKGNGAPK